MGVLSVLLSTVFLGTVFVPLIYRGLPKVAAWIAPIPALTAFAYFLFYSLSPRDAYVSESSGWVPEIGLNWSLGLSAFRLMFALLITGIGFLIVLYGGHYTRGRPYGCRMLAFLYAFMGSMLGIVLSQNLLLMVIFWELTSISSYFLIGLRFEDSYARKAAQRALITTGIGGLFLLMGVVGLGMHCKSYELDAIRMSGLASSVVWWVPVCILAGCMTKSAQFPFHGWLPGAMVAPTPISAYLHSATMVKAGVFMLAVVSGFMREVAFWNTTLIAAGTLTVLISALSLVKRDLKQILAYSTVGALGMMVALIGIGTPEAMVALSALIFTHALYKAVLFMSSGVIDRQLRTRDITQLTETRVGLPWMRLAVAAATLSMAGIPLFLGFATKEYLLKAWLHSPCVALAGFGVLAFGVIAAGSAWRLFSTVCLGRPGSPGELCPELGAMQLPVLVVAGAGLAFGWIVPYLNGLFTPEGLDGSFARLSIWYGVNAALAISLGSIVSGVLLARVVKTKDSVQEDREFLDVVFFATHRIATYTVKTLQTGHLRRYIQLTLISLLLLVGVGIWRVGGLTIPPDRVTIQAHELVVTLAIVAGAIGAVVAKNRLRAIVSLGVVGFGITAIYIMFGAPDLAMTQIFVETLTVILFVLIFYHMPKFSRLSSAMGRRFDALLACGVGALMTVLTIVAANQKHRPGITDWHAEHSLSDGQGRNIVNVILVDFRGLDTLGEITVLGVAAIGVYAILKLKPRKEEAP